MRTFLATATWFLTSLPGLGQPAINGPMVGHTDMLETRIWMQCHGPCKVDLAWWPAGQPDSLTLQPVQHSNASDAHVLEFIVGGLRPGRTYHYQVGVNGVTLPTDEPLSFRTPSLWKHRTDPPPFSVAMGSCTYINEPAYDRPGRAYGDAYAIFNSIADMAPDIMLWLGDNTYLREPDWGSRSGYLHRYTHTRSEPALQRLLRTGAHYAIWDDHDFGPNDADGSWVHSSIARETFDLFWPNPTCGVPGVEGTTTSFSHSDVDFFLLDNRTYRVPGNMRTSTPALLGADQLDWLIRALKYSDASFKLVAVGGQVLSSAPDFENYAGIPNERAELLRRIEVEGITGVVFLTGDRHFTELSQVELQDGRVLYDLTVSPLTSGTYSPRESNVAQVQGTLVEQRNFALLGFSGTRNKRTMHMAVYATNGDLLWERNITQEHRR